MTCKHCPRPIPQTFYAMQFLTTKAESAAADANNFNHSFEEIRCDADKMSPSKAMSQIALAPSKNGRTLTVLGTQYAGPGSGNLGQGYATHRQRTIGQQKDLTEAQALGHTCAGCYDEDGTQQMRCGTCDGTDSRCTAANANQTTCTNTHSSCVYTPAICKHSDFYVLISGLAGQERVKVTGMSDCQKSAGTCSKPGKNNGLPVLAADRQICEAEGGTFTDGDGSNSCLKLTIVRDKAHAVNFAEPPPLDRQIGDAINVPYPLTAPSTWRCSPKLYWAGDECNCDCGAFDPDCLQVSAEVKGCSITNNEKCSLSGTCVLLSPNEIHRKLSEYEQEVFGNNRVPNWISRTIAGFSPTPLKAGEEPIRHLNGSLPTRRQMQNKCPTQMQACIAKRGTGECAGELETALTNQRTSGTEKSTEFKVLIKCTGTDNVVTGARTGCGNAPTHLQGDMRCDADFVDQKAISPECGYDGGDCLIADEEQRLDSNGFVSLVWISEDCENLWLQGETSMAGFVGSPASFKAAQEASTDGTCEVCPGDTLFGGAPIRNHRGDYVCDGAPEGTVDTSHDYVEGAGCKDEAERCEKSKCNPDFEPFGTTTKTSTCPALCEILWPNTWNAQCVPKVKDCSTNYTRGDVNTPSTTCPTGCVFTPAKPRIGRECEENEKLFEVYPNYGTPFPQVSQATCKGGPHCDKVTTTTDGGQACRKAGDPPGDPCVYTPGTNYRIALSAGHANEEVVWVQQVSKIRDGRQWIAVARSKTANDPTCTQQCKKDGETVKCGSPGADIPVPCPLPPGVDALDLRTKDACESTLYDDKTLPPDLRNAQPDCYLWEETLDDCIWDSTCPATPDNYTCSSGSCDEDLCKTAHEQALNNILWPYWDGAACKAFNETNGEVEPFNCTDDDGNTVQCDEDLCWGMEEKAAQGLKLPIWLAYGRAYQQSRCVYQGRGFKKPLREKHISRGRLVSSITPDSKTVVVVLEKGETIGDDPYEKRGFDTTGPYTVYVRGQALTVASAKFNRRDKIPHQVLTLASPAQYNVGTVATLMEAQAAESQTLFTVGTDPTRGWKQLDDGEHGNMGILGVIQAPNVDDIMMTSVDAVWPSAWKCPVGVHCPCLYFLLPRAL